MRLLPPLLPPSSSSSPSFTLRGGGVGMYVRSWYPRLGMHAGRRAKLKIAADSNTSAKMTRPGFVNPPTFPCCYPTHSPSCPPTHSLWFILPASLSLCQNAVLYCHPAYQLFSPHDKNQRGCVCSKCPSWVYSTWCHVINQLLGINSTESTWVYCTGVCEYNTSSAEQQ